MAAFVFCSEGSVSGDVAIQADVAARNRTRLTRRVMVSSVVSRAIIYGTKLFTGGGQEHFIFDVGLYSTLIVESDRTKLSQFLSCSNFYTLVI